jgi:hypothetical protein
MHLNIRSLARRVIALAVDRLVAKADGEDFVEAVATKVKVDSAALAEHIDYDEVADSLDLPNLASEIDKAELAAEVDTAAMMENMDIDMDELANNISMHKLAVCINGEELAEYFTNEDVAGAMDHEEVAAAVPIDLDELAGHIDYGELAKKLNPLEALAASQEGAEAAPVPLLDLGDLSGRVVDAAVHRLLMFANDEVQAEERAAAMVEAAAEGTAVNGRSGDSSLPSSLGA